MKRKQSDREKMLRQIARYVRALQHNEIGVGHPEDEQAIREEFKPVLDFLKKEIVLEKHTICGIHRLAHYPPGLYGKTL